MGIEAVPVGSVDVGIVWIVFASRVICDVEELVLVVSCVGDAMGVIAALPDLAFDLVADGEGEATFNELDAAFDGLVRGGCDERVDVVRHDDEAVKCETGLIAVTEERVHHEIRVCGALKDAVTLIGDGRDGEGFGFDSDAWAGVRRHISGAKARFVAIQELSGLKPGPITKATKTAEATAKEVRR
jgi:hypothetical protein